MDYAKYTFNAEKYSKYRTEYPKEFIEYLYERVGLNNNSVIADIGSGTGKLSNQLLISPPDRKPLKAFVDFVKLRECL